MSSTHQDLSNDTTFSQIKSRVPVPLRRIISAKKGKVKNLPRYTLGNNFVKRITGNCVQTPKVYNSLIF